MLSVGQEMEAGAPLHRLSAPEKSVVAVLSTLESAVVVGVVSAIASGCRRARPLPQSFTFLLQTNVNNQEF